MITKQPTIEDIYNFDAFITTPGVRDGLLERANSGDPELTTHDTDDGPVVYYNAPHGEEIAVGRPIQLAEVGATKMGDYGYSGERQATMTDYDPTVRERLAEFLQAGFERFGMDRYKARQNAQTLMGGPSSNLPLQTGIADIVPFLGTALQTQEAARLGGESVESAKRGEYGTAAAQAGFATLGMIPGAVGTVQAGKALAPTAGKMAMDVAEKTGMPVRGLGIVEPSASAAGKATAPVSDTGFYSAVEQAALNIQRKSGTGQAFLNDITKGENVKADEVKWIGLDDFLKGKKNVTREEVQNFIAQNKVDVQEVELNNTASDAMRVAKEKVDTERVTLGLLLPQGISRLDEANLTSFWAAEAVRGDKTSLAKIQSLNLDENTMQAVMDYGNAVNKYTDAYQAAKGSLKPKFGQYTLPGGENYREILLTLPQKQQPLPEGFSVDAYSVNGVTKYGVYDANGQRYGSGATKDEALQRFSELHQDKPYKSSHWDQPNVLAHIRVNDRVDADGKKMLLVEEVQSDWHQAGRDKGYIASYKKEDVKPYTPEQAKSEFGLDNADLFWYFKVPDNTFQIPKSRFATQDEALNYVLTEKKINQYGVPDAPMKDTWYQLALKRVLKYAADNGYDRVGLTTGSRQAERYNLSKQIDAVTWIPKGDGTYDFEVLKDGATIISKRDADASWLKDNIGKELAQKIVNDQHTDILERSGRRFIEGNDLSVGGDGMKKYYDEVYPQFLQKYGKKWGAKVGETYLPIYDGKTQKAGAEPIRYVDITPEMREGVGKGQPLFTATGVGAGTVGATMQDKEKK